MKHLHAGQPLPYRTLSEEERAEIKTELVWLEEDLLRRRSKLRYWSYRKGQAEADPEIPSDLREATLFYHEQAERLVASGNRLRAYLLLQLKEQPAYAPGYHYTQ